MDNILERNLSSCLNFISSIFEKAFINLFDYLKSSLSIGNILKIIALLVGQNNYLKYV
jgi:hypothetical protein